MFRHLLAIIAAALIAPAIAHAGESIKLKGPSARPNSVTFVGYDSFDANGNPVCTPCIEQRAVIRWPPPAPTHPAGSAAPVRRPLPMISAARLP